jgi:antitoxin ParD1/3/4
MAALLRDAVATGEYASSSEVIRDALRDWRSAAAEETGPLTGGKSQ